MKDKIKSEDFIIIEKNIEKILKEKDFSIIDIEIVKSSGYHITIFLYRENLTVEDIGKMNSKVFEEINKIPKFKDNFSLELSSPGIFRVIKFYNEFNIFRNRKIKIIDSAGNVVKGRIKNFENDILEIYNENNDIIKLDINIIRKASLDG